MHVCTVPHCRPQGGVGGAPGTDVSQPVASGEAAGGNAVDIREGDREYPSAREEVHKDEGNGDGGAENQEPGGLHTNSGEPALITRPPFGASTGQYHRRHGDGVCRETIGPSQAGRDGLRRPAALVTEFRGGE